VAAAGTIFCIFATVGCLRDVWRRLDEPGWNYWLSIAESLFCGVCAIIMFTFIGGS
jgi:multisubunit Na+/H+ antiporter MnhG subunit